MRLSQAGAIPGAASVAPCRRPTVCLQAERSHQMQTSNQMQTTIRRPLRRARGPAAPARRRREARRPARRRPARRRRRPPRSRARLRAAPIADNNQALPRPRSSAARRKRAEACARARGARAAQQRERGRRQSHQKDHETCPFSTEERTRRVQLVREGGGDAPASRRSRGAASQRAPTPASRARAVSGAGARDAASQAMHAGPPPARYSRVTSMPFPWQRKGGREGLGFRV